MVGKEHGAMNRGLAIARVAVLFLSAKYLTQCSMGFDFRCDALPEEERVCLARQLAATVFHVFFDLST